MGAGIKSLANGIFRRLPSKRSNGGFIYNNGFRGICREVFFEKNRPAASFIP